MVRMNVRQVTENLRQTNKDVAENERTTAKMGELFEERSTKRKDEETWRERPTTGSNGNKITKIAVLWSDK